MPDGSINQTSFKIIVETKLHEKFLVDQLENHLQGFGEEDCKILLSLSPRKPDRAIQTRIEETIKKNYKGVKYVPQTFRQIVEKFKDTIEIYDTELNSIIDDYEEYCRGEGFITGDDRMRVVTCGKSLKENLEYDVYYRRNEGYTEHTYLGIYSDKCVVGIGKLQNIITADLVDGQLKIKTKSSEVTSDQKKNILDIIPAAKKNNNWDLSQGHTFFCVDKFYKTNFKKTTKYPLQGTKFFNLMDTLDLKELPKTEIIAQLLSEKTW